MALPSSLLRESTTRESSWRQNGQCISVSLLDQVALAPLPQDVGVSVAVDQLLLVLLVLLTVTKVPGGALFPPVLFQFCGFLGDILCTETLYVGVSRVFNH